MMRIVILALVAGLISACGGGDEPATKSAPAAPAASTAAAPAESAPAAEPASGLPAAVIEEEIQYDPIDVSKLENQWWDQYSPGS